MKRLLQWSNGSLDLISSDLPWSISPQHPSSTGQVQHWQSSLLFLLNCFSLFFSRYYLSQWDWWRQRPQKGAAELRTNFRHRQRSHIGRRNAASWSVLLFCHVPRSSLLTVPLGCLFMKNFKHFFISSSHTIAICYKLRNMGKQNKPPVLPHPFQQLCCPQNGGEGGWVTPLLALVLP